MDRQDRRAPYLVNILRSGQRADPRERLGAEPLVDNFVNDERNLEPNPLSCWQRHQNKLNQHLQQLDEKTVTKKISKNW